MSNVRKPYRRPGPMAGKVRRRLLLLLVVVLAVAIFTPTIVLRTPLRGRLLAKIVPPSVGSATAESLTAGWLTPISATKVRLYDTQGNRLADVERLAINRTLVGLLADSSQLGTIRLEEPTLYAVAGSDGSNIEDALARAIAAVSSDEESLDSASDGPDYRLEVVGGQVLSRSAATGETWLVDQLDATVVHPARGPLRIAATGTVRPATDEPPPPEAQQAGQFEFRWGGDADDQLDGVRLNCQALPVAAAQPWLARFDPQLRLAGHVTGELAVAYPKTRYDSLSGESSGRLLLTNLALRSRVLADDQLDIDETSLTWKGSASGGRLSLDRLSLASDIAMLDLRGSLDERALRATLAGNTSPGQLLLAGNLEAEGRLNLARLASRLPGLLQVRTGTTITSGQAQFRAVAEPQPSGHRFTASLTTTPLAGQSGGRPIEWDAPIAVSTVALQRNGRWRFDELVCESQFLQIAGSGDANNIDFNGQVDLDELTSRLDQFIDMTDWQLAGRGDLEATYRRDGQGQFTAEGSGTLRDFVIAHLGDRLVIEPRLQWAVEVGGTAGDKTYWPGRLSAGRVELHAAGDDLVLRLVRPTPVAETWSATEWPIEITTSGRLASWAQRLRPWVDLSAWQLAGDLQATGQGQFRAAPLTFQVNQSQATVEALQAMTENWQLDEPQLQWSGDFGWDSTTGTLTSRTGQLVSSTVAASFRDWFWTFDPEQAGQVGGLAAVRMDLGRLARLRRAAETGDTRLRPAGQVSGHVKLNADGGRMTATMDLAGRDLQLQKPQPALPGAASNWAVVWQEPELSVAGSVSYAPEADRLTLDSLQTSSNTLRLASQGQIDRLSQEMRLHLTGTADYDLANLTPILAQYIGPGVTIRGREQARFEVRGTLADTGSRPQTSIERSAAAGTNVDVTLASTDGTVGDWYARVLAPWQSADLYGLTIGQGRLLAEMDNGQMQVEPLDFAVGGGRLTAAPRIRLEPAPGVLMLEPGPLLTGVQVTPQVSARLLQYINPYLASATQVEGQFSITLSGAQVPLGAPTTSDVAGRLDVQSLRVVPGAAIGELGLLVGEIERLARGRPLIGAGAARPITLLSVSDRTVDFRLVDGRVYHQGLEFQVGNLVFRSRGSVGLDQTVSAMLEVQLPPEGRLRNVGVTRIEVPVSGTLGSMKFDASATLQNVLQQAGGQLLNEENIGNALDKLFGGDR